MRTREELALDDRMQAAYLRLERPGGGSISRAIERIQEGAQHPWRGNARRALEMQQAGLSLDEIEAVLIGEFAVWIRDVLGAARKPAA
jgi:hypothetical protein